MHYDVPLTSSRIRVVTLPLVAIDAIDGVADGVAAGVVVGVVASVVAGVVASAVASAVADRGSVGRNGFIRRDPARRLIAEKNFIKGKFNSRTRNTESVVGSRGVEPFAVVHRIRKSRCCV